MFRHFIHRVLWKAIIIDETQGTTCFAMGFEGFPGTGPGKQDKENKGV